MHRYLSRSRSFLRAEACALARPSPLFLLFLLLFLAMGGRELSAAILTWDRVDSPIVKEYRVYYGKVPGRYTTVTNVGNLLELPLLNLQEGSIYYFAVTCRTRDGAESPFSQEFQYKVPITTPVTNPPPVHLPPTLSISGNIHMLEDLPFELVLRLKDSDTPASNLVVFATYPTNSIFGTNPIVFGGRTDYRFLRLMPLTNAFGTSDITVSVTDGTTTNSQIVHLTTVPVDDAPIIQPIPALKLLPGSTSMLIPLDIYDPDTPSARLNVWAECLDSSLLPSSLLVLDGNPGSNATLQITAPPGTLGISQIRIGVADDTTTNWTSFQVTIEPANSAPTIQMEPTAWGQVSTNIRLVAHLEDDGIPLAPGELTCAWTLVSGPAQALMSSTNQPVIAAMFGIPGRYVLRLDVSDGELVTSKECVVDMLAPPPVEVQSMEQLRRRTEPTLPRILQFDVEAVTESTLTVSWDTDTLCDGRVEWTERGTGMSARTPAQRDWVTHHSIRLGNLRPGKEYSLRAWSRNLEGGERFSDPLAICTLEVVKLYQPLPVPLATLTAPLKFGRDDQGLWGVLSGSGAETGTGVMSLPFHVIQPGPCSMWVRVHPGPDTALPTSMAVDGVAMDLDVSRSAINGSGWTWACVLPRGSAPAPLALRFESTEDHHVQFAGFGPDVLLSDILITTDSDYVPEDIMPIAVLLSPAGMDTPVLIRSLRRGWNLVANPFTTPTSFPGTSIPSAVTDITIDRLNGRPTDLRSISFDGVEWSGEIQLGFKQAVRIFNPSSSPIPLVLNGVEAKDATPTGFPAGERIFTPNRLRAGLLRDLLPGFSFRKGDGIRRVDRDTGETVRNSFNGETWTMIPTLNAGESVILDLVPR